MSELKNVLLGDIADIQTGPFGSQLHASDYVANGVPCVMPMNIGQRLNFITTDIARVRIEDVQRLNRHRLQQGDIVYSRRGDVEKCAYVTPAEDGWLCGTGCLLVRVKDQSVDSRFVSYLLSTSELRGWISGHAVGTTMPNLNTSILQRVPLVLPDLGEQKRIAEVLSSLDDKIDLLHRQNQTLEQLAETLFRQWFVEDANESTVGEEFDIVMGQSPPGSTYNEVGDGLPFYQGRADFGFRFPAVRVYCSAPTRLANAGDTLLSVRAPVGDLNMASELCCIGRGVAAIRHKNKQVHSSYTYLTFRSLKENFDVHDDSGTVFGSINRTDLVNLKCTKLSADKIERFNSEIGVLDDKILVNCKQIETLTNLRETLLPRLMSGELRVDNFKLTDDARNHHILQPS